MARRRLSVEGSCTAADGTLLSVVVFADADQVRIGKAQLELYGQMMVAFGVLEINGVQAGPDDRVWVSVTTADGEQPPSRPSAEDKLLLGKIAGALEGEIFVFEPRAARGSTWQKSGGFAAPGPRICQGGT